jgi:molybdate transport system substrate-binding protein
LRAALLAADAIYFPDPKLATAGIHFAKVIEALGITADVASRLQTFTNGATAMAALARADCPHPIGCTQVTEILNTPGVTLVAPLPKGHELATIYTAGVCTGAALPQFARQLTERLSGPASRAIRDRIGFEPLT